MDKKDTRKESVRDYYVPEYGVTVQAANAEEAVKKLKS